MVLSPLSVVTAWSTCGSFSLGCLDGEPLCCGSRFVSFLSWFGGYGTSLVGCVGLAFLRICFLSGCVVLVSLCSDLYCSGKVDGGGDWVESSVWDSAVDVYFCA